MSADLDLIRAFRFEDAEVDTDSQDRARVALVEHIAGSAGGKRRVRGHRPGRRAFALRIRADVVAVALTTLIVVGVGAVFLSIGRERPQRPARHAVVGPNRPLVIRNFAPGRPPALPGRRVCAGQLTRPGVAPAGAFYMTTCQGQPAGRVGSPSGTYRANAAEVDGIKEYPFSITARGLRPNTRGSVYALWLTPAAQTGGHVGTYRLLEPQRPRLLAVIRPGVGRDGKLAADGLLPPDLLNNDFLLRVTLQPNPSSTTPGRTVLRGFVSTYFY